MKPQFAPWATRDRPGATTVRSADGALSISLRRTAAGVFVERSLQRRGTARALQAANFRGAGEFRQWCEASNMRFDDPLMFNRLVRHADDLFDIHAPPTIAG